ncbi:MAG: DNA repair protein RecO [Candidatus Pacebacteria bacterium]|nr:DNA repair protein RecO [Candidatus Paceibacterota bacterium]
MGHSIYNTEGIILGSFPVGEADKFFRIFTRELGLIEATAQGVRKTESKNRYGLQDFSLSDISLVRGREVWRITNVSTMKNLFFDLEEKKEARDSLIKIILFVQKLVHGEEKNEKLFDLILSAFEFLKQKEINATSLKNFELIYFLKILDNLGYFDQSIQEEKFKDFLSYDIDDDLINKMSLVEKDAQREIEGALRETHL